MSCHLPGSVRAVLCSVYTEKRVGEPCGTQKEDETTVDSHRMVYQSLTQTEAAPQKYQKRISALHPFFFLIRKCTSSAGLDRAEDDEAPRLRS